MKLKLCIKEFYLFHLLNPVEKGCANINIRSILIYSILLESTQRYFWVRQIDFQDKN